MDPTAAGWILGTLLVLVAVVFLVLTRPLERRLRRSLRARPAIMSDVSLTTAEVDELRELNNRAGKIPAIKRLRELRPLGLADAKKVIDVLDAGGTIPVASATTDPTQASGVSPQPAGTLADNARLLRDRAGPIHAIKYVREQTGMGLAEAKAFVDALR